MHKSLSNLSLYHIIETLLKLCKDLSIDNKIKGIYDGGCTVYLEAKTQKGKANKK